MQLQKTLVIIAFFATSAQAWWRNAYCNKPNANDGDDKVATEKACGLARTAGCNDCRISGYCFSDHTSINPDTWNGYCTNSGAPSGGGY
ncbi:hypothetical protein HYALB_00004114 [Hymenoscyphus albidus]|uniref:Uncharacterized protein n=1 Tax=Hymenoscyphus albidus TaxID=595503 RepID=A0A9N9M1L7_9HELO|nr:hypothetical protein HYALB_00004114 [Hymenoscyphus albidus]